MVKSKKQEPKVKARVQKTHVPSNCGSVPTRPGGTGAGDWQCRDGKWVWVENIGG